MPVNDGQPRLINTQNEIDTLCGEFASAGQNGCDTEFMRTQTYWPELCLVQVATREQTACIDVLAPIDTSEFRQILRANPEPLILHAAKQDLEAWYATWQELPTAVFDIQIAAGLLGFQPQIGYGNLVNELLDVKLDKDQTRTDWSRRPLTDKQISYATDDVAYLHDIYDIVCTRLTDSGRYEWALADSATLVDSNLYDAPPEDAWLRLSAIPYLPVVIQARARALTAWRETRAKQANRPRQWILGDKALLKIAHANLERVEDLSNIEDLQPAGARKQGQNILQIVQRANDDAANGSLDLTQTPVPLPPDKNHVQKLSAIVRDKATELDIAPELLATRRDIISIINGNADARPLHGWRQAVIGEKLLGAC